jgi:hypothetical protein
MLSRTRGCTITFSIGLEAICCVFITSIAIWFRFFTALLLRQETPEILYIAFACFLSCSAPSLSLSLRLFNEVGLGFLLGLNYICPSRGYKSNTGPCTDSVVDGPNCPCDSAQKHMCLVCDDELIPFVVTFVSRKNKVAFKIII